MLEIAYLPPFLGFNTKGSTKCILMLFATNYSVKDTFLKNVS